MNKRVTGAKTVTGDRWLDAARRCATRHLSLLLTCHLFLLTACGFQPVHSQSYRASQAADLSAILFEVSGVDGTPNAVGSNAMVARRYSELLKAEITDQLNPTGTRAEKQFKVAISYTEQQVGLFVNPDGTASRGDLVLTSSYTITRLADAKTITTGSIARTSSFNTSPTADYASYVSIEDARQRGVIGLAQDYKLRLATLLPTLNNPNAAASKSAAPAEPVPALQPIRSYETFRSGY